MVDRPDLSEMTILSGKAGEGEGEVEEVCVCINSLRIYLYLEGLGLRVVRGLRWV